MKAPISATSPTLNHRVRKGLRAGTILLIASFASTAANAAYVVDHLLVAIHKERAPESAIVQVVPTGSPIEVLAMETDFAQVRTSDGITGWVDASYVTEEKPARLRLSELEGAVAERTQALAAAETRIETLEAELQNARAENRKHEDEERDALENKLNEHAQDVKALSSELEQALEQNRLLKEEAALRELAAKQDASAEIEALKEEIAKLERANASRAPAPIASPDLRELQRLAEENQRVKDKLESLKAELIERQRKDDRPGLFTWRWRIADATIWELAGVVFIVVLAFALGGFLVDRSSRRRMGGFRF